MDRPWCLTSTFQRSSGTGAKNLISVRVAVAAVAVVLLAGCSGQTEPPVAPSAAAASDGAAPSVAAPSEAVPAPVEVIAGEGLSTFYPGTIQELKDGSEAILVGTVTDITLGAETGPDDERLVPEIATVRIDAQFTGERLPESVEVWNQWHVADDPGTKVVASHEPYLAQGQQYVLGVVHDIGDDEAPYGVATDSLFPTSQSAGSVSRPTTTAGSELPLAPMLDGRTMEELVEVLGPPIG